MRPSRLWPVVCALALAACGGGGGCLSHRAAARIKARPGHNAGRKRLMDLPNLAVRQYRWRWPAPTNATMQVRIADVAYQPRAWPRCGKRSQGGRRDARDARARARPASRAGAVGAGSGPAAPPIASAISAAPPRRHRGLDARQGGRCRTTRLVHPRPGRAERGDAPPRPSRRSPAPLQAGRPEADRQELQGRAACWPASGEALRCRAIGGHRQQPSTIWHGPCAVAGGRSALRLQSRCRRSDLSCAPAAVPCCKVNGAGCRS